MQGYTRIKPVSPVRRSRASQGNLQVIHRLSNPIIEEPIHFSQYHLNSSPKVIITPKNITPTKQAFFFNEPNIPQRVQASSPKKQPQFVFNKNSTDDKYNILLKENQKLINLVNKKSWLIEQLKQQNSELLNENKQLESTYHQQTISQMKQFNEHNHTRQLISMRKTIDALMSENAEQYEKILHIKEENLQLRKDHLKLQKSSHKLTFSTEQPFQEQEETKVKEWLNL